MECEETDLDPRLQAEATGATGTGSKTTAKIVEASAAAEMRHQIGIATGNAGVALDSIAVGGSVTGIGIKTGVHGTIARSAHDSRARKPRKRARVKKP